MNQNFKTIAFSFLVLALAIGVGFFYDNDKVVEALSTANTDGYAWSSNIGWVKFNGPSYGVSVNPDTGVFSGQAWSSNVGWLDFDATGPGKTKATLPVTGGNMSGWARFLSHGDGWDGWVEFSKVAFTPGTGSNPGTFSGYAWGDDVVGWMKMSGVTVDIAQLGCSDSTYAAAHVAECGDCDDPEYRAVHPECPEPQTDSYDLDVDVQGNGSVTGLGINCGSGDIDCSESRAGSFSGNLTATADTGWVFTSWSGCNSTSGSDDSICTVNVNDPNVTKSVRAIFDEEVCTGPTCIGVEVFDFNIDGEVRFMVINPPSETHSSSRIKIVPSIGENIVVGSIDVSDDGMNALESIASTAGVVDPSLNLPTDFAQPFDLYITFPAKARNTSGVNMYNTNRMPINITITGTTLGGATVSDTINAYLRYVDPTIVQE